MVQHYHLLLYCTIQTRHLHWQNFNFKIVQSIVLFNSKPGTVLVDELITPLGRHCFNWEDVFWEGWDLQHLLLPCLHLIGMWVCWCGEEGFFFLAKVFFLSLSFHKENISRWTQTVTIHVQIHTQFCYETTSVVIFTGLSLSLPLQNPIREMYCIKGSIKGFKISL